MKNKQDKPKILVLDIETSPLITYTWKLYDQVMSVDQIIEDWYVLAFAAKWVGDKKVTYFDQRNEKDMSNDKNLLKKVWKLLDDADIIITQNGKKFDEKKLNSRFILHGFKPYSSFKHIDVYEIAKKKFGFTSNRLEYLTNKLCSKHKKSKHGKFPGLELWKQCLKGNKSAWREMERYNKLDVTSLEELYHKVIPWDNRINFNLYHDKNINICKCGSTEFSKNGYAYTSVGKFQRFCCKKCGAEARSRDNLFSKEKKKSLRVKVK